jgi:uncharacterized protein
MLQQKTIETINSRLANIPGVEKIILFGSQSRGTADKNSDIDLIILVEKFNDRYEMSRYIRKKLSGLEYAFDIIVMTVDEFDLDKNIPGTISRYAYKEGEILYAA